MGVLWLVFEIYIDRGFFGLKGEAVRGLGASIGSFCWRVRRDGLQDGFESLAGFLLRHMYPSYWFAALLVMYYMFGKAGSLRSC